jgi:hypothetical protein
MFKPMTNRRQIEQAKRIIDALPQRNVMRDEDIERWIEIKLKEDPDRIVWHARRLSGFGGSEIGVLVAAMRNASSTAIDAQYHTFKSARDVVAEKLCKILPNSQDEDIDPCDSRRGIVGEAFLANILIEQLKKEYECEIELDNNTMDVMKGSLNDKKHPWLEGNIDLALIIGGDKRILVDIKWPRSGNAQANQLNAAFSYVSQLHQYKMVASRLPVPVDFDAMVLAAFDSDTFQFYPAQIERDIQLEQDILEAGDHYFQEFVLKGKVPPFPKRRNPVVNAHDFRPDIKNMIERGVSLKAMESKLSEMLIKNTQMLNQTLKSDKTYIGKFNATTGSGALSSKVKYTYDYSALNQLAERCSVDIRAEDPTTAKALHSLLLKRLEELNDITEYELNCATGPEQSFITTVSRKSKGLAADLVQNAKDVAENEINRYVSTICQNTANLEEELLAIASKESEYSDVKLVIEDGINIIHKTYSSKALENINTLEDQDNSGMLFQL